MIDAPESLVAAILRSRWWLVAVTALVATLLIAASVSWRDNRFSLEVTTRRVTLIAARRAEHDLGIKLPAEAKLQLSGYEVADPPYALRELLQRGRPVVLQSGSIVIGTIVLDDGGELTVSEPSAGRIELELTGAARMVISLGGAVTAGSPDGAMLQLGPFERPESLEATARAGGGNPLRVVIVSAGSMPLPFALRDQPISRVSFARPRASTADTRFPFRSEIVSGSLSLLDIDAKTTLRPGDLVWLRDIVAHLVALDVRADGIAIDIAGEAARIGTGPPRGEGWRPDRDLTPSVFGYLAGQHELKLLWGAAVLVVVALWKARQWAQKYGT